MPHTYIPFFHLYILIFTLTQSQFLKEVKREAAINFYLAFLTVSIIIWKEEVFVKVADLGPHRRLSSETVNHVVL